MFVKTSQQENDMRNIYILEMINNAATLTYEFPCVTNTTIACKN